jgi:hypothetical protein
MMRSTVRLDLILCDRHLNGAGSGKVSSPVWLVARNTSVQFASLLVAPPHVGQGTVRARAGRLVGLIACSSSIDLRRKLEVHSQKTKRNFNDATVAAGMVVATCAVIVLLISRLFPYGAGWPGVCVAISYSYASTFGAWALLGNKPGKSARVTEGKIVQGHLLRDNLLYFGVGMAAVTIVIAVTIHDTDRGIDRYFKNDWLVGVGSACFVLGYAGKGFWIFHRNCVSG